MQSWEELSQNEAVRRLADSAEGKKLGSLVDGAALEQALRGGDTAAMKRMLAQVLQSPEGRKLCEQLRGLRQE